MDETQAAAFCEYAIGLRIIFDRDTGDKTYTPHAPRLQEFVAARLGDLMPRSRHCEYLHPANRTLIHNTYWAPRAQAFADLLREVADAIDPPKTEKS